MSERIVDAVAEREGVSATDLDAPLFEAVDPEALDALFPPTREGATARTFEFTYHGYDVTVRHDDETTVEVEPAADGPRTEEPTAGEA